LNVPKLRFPEFEGTWEIRKLGDIAEKIGDGLHGTPLYVDESDYYFINGNNLVNGKVEINENTKKIDIETYIKNDKGLKKNSLLISINGTIGNIAKYNNEKVMLGKSVAYYNFHKNSDFFYFSLQTKSIQDFFNSELTGSTIKNLSLKTLRETYVATPSDEEQEKIANFLSLIDERIQTQSKIIEQLETLIREFRNQIFNRRIRFKDEHANEFSKWREVIIGDILKIGNGKDYKHLQSGEIPVFGTGGFMDWVNSYLFEGETVCIGRKGTINKPMYYNGKIWTVDTLFYTHSFKSCIPKFVYYLFKSINWLEYNEASGVPSLSKTTIEKISINLPSLEEQNRIATFLSKIDQKIQFEKSVLQQLEKQKKYLLQQMFV